LVLALLVGLATHTSAQASPQSTGLRVDLDPSTGGVDVYLVGDVDVLDATVEFEDLNEGRPGPDRDPRLRQTTRSLRTLEAATIWEGYRYGFIGRDPGGSYTADVTVWFVSREQPERLFQKTFRYHQLCDPAGSCTRVSYTEFMVATGQAVLTADEEGRRLLDLPLRMMGVDP
jgi:hypothetical protein